jgi:hypothetical protein
LRGRGTGFGASGWPRKNAASRSRDSILSELLISFRPEKRRAGATSKKRRGATSEKRRGECRASYGTRGWCKKCTGSRHRFTGINRHSLRDGFTVSFELFPVTGLCCHRRQRDAKKNSRHHRQLDASVGASEPHDFAVRRPRRSSTRITHMTTLPASTASCPNVRDDGQRPSSRNRTHRKGNRPERKARNFSNRDWTTQIRLNSLGKSGFASALFQACEPSSAACDGSDLPARQRHRSVRAHKGRE